MKGTFDISNLTFLNAFLKPNLQGLPDWDSISFESYGEEESEGLHDFYGSGKQDITSKEKWWKLTRFMT